MKKKKKIQTSYDYTRTFLIFAIVFSIIIAISTYWIYAYNHKHSYLNNDFVSYKIDDYAYIKGNMVYLKNIDNKVINDFINSQNKININNVIDTDINKTIYKNILSIKIKYVLYGELSNYEEILTLNYNLKENKLVDNDSLLNMTKVTYKDIADSLFNEYIKLDDTSVKVVDAITNEEVTGTEFNDNSYKYIIRIRENLPDIMNLYIKDGKLYYVVKLKDINKLCYQTNMDVSSRYIDEEIDKL